VSDYLQALVERARGEARTVRPLLAPRFASGPRAEELEIDVEVPAAPRRAAPEAPATSTPAPVDAGTPRGVVPRTPAPPRPAAVDPQPRVESRRAPAADTTEHPGSADPANDATLLQVEETTSVVERHLVEETTRQTSEPSAPVVVTVERVPGPEAPEHPPDPQTAAAPAGVQALPAGVVEDLGSIAEVEPDTQTVVVSIDRIEVNAERPSPSPPPSPARSWAGPRLSLDDYLRERSGGRR
jgi:hypothetical protein